MMETAHGEIFQGKEIACPKSRRQQIANSVLGSGWSFEFQNGVQEEDL